MRNLNEIGDVAMLMSAVNMLLRDEYGTLENLCKGEDCDEGELKKRLASGGFEYDSAHGRFW